MLKTLKKGDLLIGIMLAALIAASLGSFKVLQSFSNSGAKTAVITKDGKVLNTISLDSVKKQETIEIKGDYNHTILVEPGRIRFSEADCPDKICVRTGWLTDIGNTSVCLPDRIIIKIQGSTPKAGEEIDSVSY